MGQHYLRSAASRPLPVERVLRMSEERAYREFLAARWPGTGGAPSQCPRCGVAGGRIYATGRRRFRCAACRGDFTVTSGTIFASHKLGFRQMLAAISLAANTAKNEAALLLTRQLGVQYKTAWVLLMKLREAIASERASLCLEGTVEIDATYVGGHRRKENKAAARKDGRLAENRTGKRRCVLAMRQRNGRIMTVIAKTESAQAAVELAKRHVARGAVIVSDYHEAYANLAAFYPHMRVNHDVEYATDDGVNTNQVESFFARVKRSQKGTHHRFSGPYLDWYVAELAYREDMRRRDNGWIARDLLRRALAHPVSRWLAGYWQGRHPAGEFLWEPPWERPPGPPQRTG